MGYFQLRHFKTVLARRFARRRGYGHDSFQKRQSNTRLKTTHLTEISYRVTSRFFAALALIGLTAIGAVADVHAADVTNPSSGSVGLSGKVSAPPPTQAATITTPVNGATITELPTTVTGLCKTDLLVKIFDNGIFMGAVVCKNGSYSIQIGLFSSRNELVARVFDNLDQAGPDSNTVVVTFNDGQFGQYASRVTLTSPYARRGAAPNDTLTWPFVISGGLAPYAVSIDWGDGSTPDLISVATGGTFTGSHVYKKAGQYTVIVKATDKNGTTAYLQVVGVANGAAGTTDSGGTGTTATIIKLLWWPALLIAPFTLLAFWLGRRHQMYSLRRQLEKQRQNA